MSERIGWTNGCFDILHPGHIYFLRQCLYHCDRLIVGLNTDESIRQIKGPSRPVNSFRFRKAMLEGLQGISDVRAVDNEPSLRVAIMELAPDVILKGDDYLRKEVVGWEFAPIKYIRRLEDYSTTNEIAKRDRLA